MDNKTPTNKPGEKPQPGKTDNARKPPSFLADKPKPGPDQRPDGMPTFEQRNKQPALLDVYDSPSLPDYPDEDAMILDARMGDAEGEDTAYDLGMTDERLPAKHTPRLADDEVKK